MVWWLPFSTRSRLCRFVGRELLSPKSRVIYKKGGGEGGIRTRDTRERIPLFESGAFNHSATSPFLIVGMEVSEIKPWLWSPSLVC